jgi:hypothetical protein
MLDSGSASSRTSSVASGLLSPPARELLPRALRLQARRLQPARLRGLWSLRPVSLSTQGIRRQYWGLRLLLRVGGITTVYVPSTTVASGRVASACRMDLPGPTTSVGTRTDYSVGPWDYPACATRHLMAWSTRTTEEKDSVRKLYMFRTV